MGKQSKINPKKFYLVDLRDPKKPRIGATSFLFKELAIAAKERYFPGMEMVFVVTGKELEEEGLYPVWGAYTTFRFSVKAYNLPEGLTHRQKVTLRKRYRRTRRRLKYREALKVPSDAVVNTKWANLEERAKKEEGKVTAEAVARIRRRQTKALYRKFDHL